MQPRKAAPHTPHAPAPESRLRPPAFAEQNFGTSSNLQTVVWIESDQGMRSDHPSLFVAGPVVQASVRGQISADSSDPPLLLNILLPQPPPPPFAPHQPPHVLALLFLGFSPGLPFMLVFSTLSA